MGRIAFGGRMNSGIYPAAEGEHALLLIMFKCVSCIDF